MTIEVERLEQGIVRVVLANPERRNALTLAMFEGLAELWPKLAGDGSVRVVVVTGQGDTFCSGADLSANLPARPGIDDLIEAAFMKTSSLPVPVIAAINGDCVAGGLEIALSADVRIASETARLGFPEVRWGIMPSGGGSMKLADQIGWSQAMDLLLSGRLISAREAERLGLVSRVVPGADIGDTAMDYARTIAANSPVAVRATKEAAIRHRLALYRQLEKDERSLVAQVRSSGHPAIGVAAFLAKIKPVYPDS